MRVSGQETRAAAQAGGRSSWIGVALVGTWVLVLGACSPPRAFEAAGLLYDLTGDAEGEVAETVRRTIGGDAPGEVLGDLYWPAEEAEAEAALVLVPGAAPRGREDPRLVRFAHALAEARFAILVPEIPSLRALQVRPADADAIAAAVHDLARCVPADGKGTVGLAGISYAAGPAILAALEEDTDELVGLIVAIGGYHDLEAVVTYFTTGYYRGTPNEPWQHRNPNAYGKWLFVRANAERLSEQDAPTLRAIAQRKLADLDADVVDLARDLGPDGRAVMALLRNRDPERVPALIAELPEAVRDDLAALDLERRDLSRLDAEVILIHGRDDPIVPATESEALAAALPDERVHLFIVDHLAHVDLGASSLLDGLELWRAAYRVLGARNAAPAPIGLAPCTARLQGGSS